MPTHGCHRKKWSTWDDWIKGGLLIAEIGNHFLKPVDTKIGSLNTDAALELIDSLELPLPTIAVWIPLPIKS